MQAEQLQTAEKLVPASSREWPPSAPRLLLGAVIGSALGWAAIQSLYPIFVVPPEMALLPDPPPIAEVKKLEALKYVVDAKNFAILFALVGLFLGTSYAVSAFGWRKLRHILTAGGLGALGCLAGILLCNAIIAKMRAAGGTEVVLLGLTLDNLQQTILAQACLWGLTGLGIGIGLAPSVKSAVTAGISGLVGGVLAAMLYAVGVAFFMPHVGVYHAFPLNPGEQFVWLAFSACMVGLTMALGTGEKARKAEEQKLESPEATSAAV